MSLGNAVEFSSVQCSAVHYNSVECSFSSCRGRRHFPELFYSNRNLLCYFVNFPVNNPKISLAMFYLGCAYSLMAMCSQSICPMVTSSSSSLSSSWSLPETPNPGTFAPPSLFCLAQAVGIFINQPGITCGARFT